MKKYRTTLPAADVIQNEVLFQLEDVKEVVLDSEEEGDEIDDQDKCYRVSLLEVKYKARYNRTKDAIACLNGEAAKNKVNINQLLGVIIKQVNYHSENRVATSQIADMLIKDKEENISNR